MEKHYFFRQKTWLYIVSSITIIILLTFDVVNIMKLCNVGSLESFNHPIDICAIVVMSIVAIMMASITFGSGYWVKKECFAYNLGLTFKKIKYEDILLARLNNERTILLLYYKVDKNGVVTDANSGIQADIIQINIAKTKFDEIIELIKSHNNNVVVEILPTKE